MQKSKKVSVLSKEAISAKILVLWICKYLPFLLTFFFRWVDWGYGWHERWPSHVEALAGPDLWNAFKESQPRWPSHWTGNDAKIPERVAKMEDCIEYKCSSGSYSDRLSVRVLSLTLRQQANCNSYFSVVKYIYCAKG